MARKKTELETDVDEYNLEDTSRSADRYKFTEKIFAPIFRLIARLENLIHRSKLVDSIYRLLDSAAQAKDVIQRGVSQIWNAVVGSIVQSSYAEGARIKLDASSQKVSQKIDDLRVSVLAAGERSRTAQFLDAIGQLCRRMFFHVRQFVMEWFVTRNYRHLLGGVPAIALTLPLAMCLVRMPFYGSFAKAQHYRQAMNDAIDSKNIAEINLFHRKLSQISVRESDVMSFQSGVALHESGNTEEAMQRMRQLAPLDEPGFAPAHLWIAKQLLEVEEPQRDSAQIITHLRHALSQQPDRVDVAVWLADQYRIAGSTDLALEIIGKYEGAIRDPSIRIHIADLYQNCGKRDEAIRIAREVESSVRAMHAEATQSGQSIRNLDYLAWSFAAQIRNDLAEAMRVLELGLNSFPEDKPLTEYADMTRLLSGSRHNTPNQIPDVARIKKLLENEFLRDQLVLHLSAILNSNPNNESFRQLLEEDLQSNSKKPVPPSVSETLAKLALKAGEFDVARRHFETMVASDQKNAIAMNDLAWLLAYHEPIDLKRALKLIDQAIEIEPRNAHLRDTRGHILVKLDRWQDAVVELEQAVNGLPGNGNTHAVLAWSYEKLGNAELAEAHRRLSGNAK